jgi:hypothetical protein
MNPTAPLQGNLSMFATTPCRGLSLFRWAAVSWAGSARNAPGGAHLARMNLYNRVIFGLGLALWTAVLQPL